MTRAAIAEAAPKHPLPDRPRVVRMPSDWWDAPSVVALALAPGTQSAKTARRFTRATLQRWGLDPLADAAEVIVAELVANAICHTDAGAAVDDRSPGRADTRIGLRLFRRAGEVMCAVLDPSDTAPVLKAPNSRPNADVACSWLTRGATYGDGAPSSAGARPSGPFSSAPDALRCAGRPFLVPGLLSPKSFVAGACCPRRFPFRPMTAFPGP